MGMHRSGTSGQQVCIQRAEGQEAFFVDMYVEIKGRSLLSPSWLGLQGHFRILQLKARLGTRVRLASSF